MIADLSMMVISGSKQARLRAGHLDEQGSEWIGSKQARLRDSPALISDRSTSFKTSKTKSRVVEPCRP